MVSPGRRGTVASTPPSSPRHQPPAPRRNASGPVRRLPPPPVLLAALLLAFNASVWLWGGVSDMRREGLLSLLGLRDRRPSFPLVTGDGFRAMADRRCDETGCGLSLMPAVVSPGDIVFVKADLLRYYLAVLAPRITDPHVVVSHNGDTGVGKKEVALLEGAPSVTAVFTPNIDVERLLHPRLLSVPIGIENRQYKHGAGPQAYENLPAKDALARLLGPFAETKAEKKKGDSKAKPALWRILFAAFDIGTNPPERTRAALAVTAPGSDDWATVRVSGWDKASVEGMGPADAARVAEAAKKSPPAVRGAAKDDSPRSGATSPPFLHLPNAALAAVADGQHAQYLESLATHAFTLSPPGHGAQAHRTWEALHAGSVPIVRRTGTAMDDIYRGLPVLLVETWEDVTRENLLRAGKLFARVLKDTLDHEERAGALPAEGGALSIFSPLAVRLRDTDEEWDSEVPVGTVFDLRRIWWPHWEETLRRAAAQAAKGA
jgi:hypothetical protein